MDYLERLEELKDEMTAALQEWVKIPSVVGEAAGDMPFGEEVHRAYRYIMDLAEKEGFETFDADHYGGHLEFGGWVRDEEGEIRSRSPEALGIIGHVDVVPAGDPATWSYDPYSGEIVDGVMFGRGTSDDKGPLIAAFYAMKALKDSGFEPAKRVRMILGLDEETDWIGIRHYLERTAPPDLSFTPDAEFPLIHGEKGFLIFTLARKFGKTVETGIQLRKITGGTAPNAVPDSASALIRATSYEKVRVKLKEFKERTGYGISARGRGKSLEIVAEGTAAHGATPWKGLNAISVLMAFLGELNVINEDVRDFIEFYNSRIGFETDGLSIGCADSDECSGGLVFNVGMIRLDEEVGEITVNIRYPISGSDTKVFAALEPVMNEYDLGMIKGKQEAPIFTDPESPLVQTLMDIYRQETGDTEARSLVVGGGTYARALPNTVAFGALFPGEPDVMHQRNESIRLDSLMKAAKIYARAIYELTK